MRNNPLFIVLYILAVAVGLLMVLYGMIDMLFVSMDWHALIWVARGAFILVVVKIVTRVAGD